jgi:hypothetical protein
MSNGDDAHDPSARYAGTSPRMNEGRRRKPLAYCAATARGRALTTEALPEVISSWIHL